MLFIILLLQVVAFFVEWLFMLPVFLLSYRVKRAQHMSRLPANPIFNQTNVPAIIYEPVDMLADWRSFFSSIADYLIPFFLILFSFIYAIAHFLHIIISGVLNILAPSEPTLNYQPSMGRHNAFDGQHRGFHTSAFVSSGLSRHNTHPSVPINLSQNDTRPYWIPGETLPEASQFL
jgi:hypothetical protein